MAKKVTSVAVVSNVEITAQIEDLRNSIPQLISEQEAYLKSLQGDEEDTKIDLSIEYNGEAIKSIDKVATLIEIEASIRARESAYTAILKERGLEDKVVEWNQSNKGISHWNLVLTKSYTALINKSEIAKIKERLIHLKQHLSEDAKVKATLEKLIKEGNTKLK